jgi:serine protease Do
VRRVSPAKDVEGDSPAEPRRSSGSGFVIDPSGTIVTNAHVVEGSEWIQVRLFDGRRFEAKLLGRDNRVDLAVLKVEGAGKLPVLALGDSNRVRVGEFVMALGHPFGLEHSVSFGIVSRKGAPLTVAAPGFDFIQTDAAINPGNSGGPLVNMAGEVVGVNSMAARNGSIGFAIPSNLVAMLVPQLANKGKVEWGWLGVSITELTDEDVSRLKLAEPKGVLIRAVMPGEPADKGGIKANDVITALDGAPLEGPRDLQRIVSSTPVGKTLRVGLLREGQPAELEVIVGLYKERDTR